MKSKSVIICETNMDDGIDRFYQVTSVKEALETGRFDYLVDEDESNFYELSKIECLESFIEKVGYPFSLLN